MAGRVLTGDRPVVKTLGIAARLEKTHSGQIDLLSGLFAPSCWLEKTDSLPKLIEVYSPFSPRYFPESLLPRHQVSQSRRNTADRSKEIWFTNLEI